MSKPQTKCVFCGGIPATKGHIWPEWLDKVLPPVGNTHEMIVGDPKTFELKVRGPAPYRKTRQGHSGTRKPRNTCLKCNTGWMSRIENSVVPIVSGLIKDDPCLIRPMDQLLLSAFLCLITIRFEFTDTDMQAIPYSDRLHIMKRGEPGPAWQIWIARYLGDRPHDHWCRHYGLRVLSSPTDDISSSVCNTQITTMVMGKLCAHVFSSTVMSDFPGYRDAPLVRIWPPSQFYIDSREIPDLSDDEIVSLHEAIPATMKPVIV